MLGFEFDLRKSSLNREKHGIDFLQAQEIWSGLVLEFQVRVEPEPRLLVIGKIGEKYWTAVVTKRADRIRIISVRRSREEEKAEYERRRIYAL